MDALAVGTWEVETDAGWRAYTGESAQLLSAAKTGTVRFAQRGQQYTVDLLALTQTNTVTGKVRRIRRAEPPIDGGWLVETDSGWQAYDAASSAALSREAGGGGGNVQLTMHGFKYSVDVVALTQTNTTTGKVRRVRRGTPAAGGRSWWCRHTQVESWDGLCAELRRTTVIAVGAKRTFTRNKFH